MPTPLLYQVSFRGRNDDGSEATATWKGAELVPFVAVVGRVFRWRALIGVQVAPITRAYALEVSADNGSTWSQVTATSNGVRVAATSQGIADHSATTEQLVLPVPYSGGGFVAGSFQTNDGVSASINLLTNQATELEWTLVAVAKGNYLLRVVDNSGLTPFAGGYVYGSIVTLALSFSQQRAYKDIISLYKRPVGLVPSSDGFITGTGIPNPILAAIPCLVEQTDYDSEPSVLGRTYKPTVLTNDIIEMPFGLPITDAMYLLWESCDGMPINAWAGVQSDPQNWPSSGSMTSNYMRVRTKAVTGDPTVVPSDSEVA